MNPLSYLRPWLYSRVDSRIHRCAYFLLSNHTQCVYRTLAWPVFSWVPRVFLLCRFCFIQSVCSVRKYQNFPLSVCSTVNNIMYIHVLHYLNIKAIVTRVQPSIARLFKRFLFIYPSRRCTYTIRNVELRPPSHALVYNNKFCSGFVATVFVQALYRKHG